MHRDRERIKKSWEEFMTGTFKFQEFSKEISIWINYKIYLVFQVVDNTGVFYKSRNKVVPLK